MKRKLGLIALSLTLTAALAACSNTAENGNPDPSAPAVAPTASAQPTASPNTVTKGLEETARGIGDTARGAVNDVGRMAQGAGNAIENSMR